MSLLVLLRSILGVASSVLDPIAGAIATVIGALSVSPSVRGTHWDPGVSGIDALPTGIVGLPRIVRTGLDKADSQLGSKDWTITYPVALIFDLSEAQYSQAQAAEVV